MKNTQADMPESPTLITRRATLIGLAMPAIIRPGMLMRISAPRVLRYDAEGLARIIDAQAWVANEMEKALLALLTDPKPVPWSDTSPIFPRKFLT